MINSHSPFFSIITASLNRAETLEFTLRSVMNQTFHSVEHIVVDGLSSDGSIDILKNYYGKYNLSWISESDEGIADALNKGLSMAKGRYILVLQADDQLLRPEILEVVHLKLRQEQFAVHSFPVIVDDPTRGRVLRPPIRFLWWNHFKFIFPHQGTFVHSRVFDNIGKFRKYFSICMDYDFFYRALAANHSVKFERTPVALMGGDGVGSRLSSVVKRLQEERLVQNLNEENILWRVSQLVFGLLYVQYKTHIFLCVRNNL